MPKKETNLETKRGLKWNVKRAGKNDIYRNITIEKILQLNMFILILTIKNDHYFSKVQTQEMWKSIVLIIGRSCSH